MIDRFRHSDEAPKLSRSWATATVVLLTDGEHFLSVGTDSDGRIETSRDILGHVFNTLQRSEDVQFAFVGIGGEADDESMIAWASEATDKQKAYAATSVPPVRLVNDRLYVKADANDENFDKIVRSFIDMASSTAPTGA